MTASVVAIAIDEDDEVSRYRRWGMAACQIEKKAGESVEGLDGLHHVALHRVALCLYIG